MIVLTEEMRKNDTAASDILNGIEQILFNIDCSGKPSEKDKTSLTKYREQLSVYASENARMSSCCKDEVNEYLKLVDEILGNN